MLTPSKDIMSDIHMTQTFLSWGEGQSDLYFMDE